MRVRSNPNLIRQKITQLWSNYFYIQKPFKIENIFIITIKIFLLIKFFLITFRNSKIFWINTKLKEQIKDRIYQLPNFSNLQLFQPKFERKKKNLYFFFSLILRTNFSIQKNNSLFNKKIRFIFEKKLKKNIYKTFFNNKYQIILKNKTLNFLKKKQLYFLNNFLKIKKNKYLLNKTLKIKKNYKNLFFLIFKTLKKKKFQKLNIKKKSLIKKKKIKNNKTYYKYIIKNKIKWKIFQIIQKKKNLKILNNLKIKIKKKIWKFSTNIKNKKQKKFLFLKIKKKKNYKTIFILLYTNFLNRILEFKLQTKFIEIIQKTKINILFKLQSLQNFSKIFKNLLIFSRFFFKKTAFLRNNKKAYKNLLFLLPIIEISQNFELLNEQFTIEFTRTKKYWRIIKCLELLIISFFTQIWELNKIKSQFSGIKFIITGRPGRSGRTQKHYLNFGYPKQTTFKTINTTKIFKNANARIGTFGITILTTT